MPRTVVIHCSRPDPQNLTPKTKATSERDSTPGDPLTGAPFTGEAPELPQAETNRSVDDEANEWYWAHICDEDREHLLGPSLGDRPTQGELARRLEWVRRRHSEPCSWCGGRLRHNPMCCARTWEPTMPFGAHKGKPLPEVPSDYLKWLLETATDLNDGLRAAVERCLSEDAD